MAINSPGSTLDSDRLDRIFLVALALLHIHLRWVLSMDCSWWRSSWWRRARGPGRRGKQQEEEERSRSEKQKLRGAPGGEHL